LKESNQRAENVRKVHLQMLRGDFEKLRILELENILELRRSIKNNVRHVNNVREQGNKQVSF
jgi:hypothetical protein